ncbi:hypothetical protein BH09VER1_BH09VER1_23850 [soil metagenome]
MDRTGLHTNLGSEVFHSNADGSSFLETIQNEFLCCTMLETLTLFNSRSGFDRFGLTTAFDFSWCGWSTKQESFNLSGYLAKLFDERIFLIPEGDNMTER